MKYSSTYLKSFTLIELLIVIAIIGILAVSLIPRITGMQHRAKVTAIKTIFKNLQTQALIYHSEHGTYKGLCTYNASGATAHHTIQPFISALTDIVGDKVRCVIRTSDVPRTNIDTWGYQVADSLETKNFGVAVYFNRVHYAVDATDVMTLDQANVSSTNMIWLDAMNTCVSLGKKLPPVEVLKAINDYGAYGGNLSFPAGNHWSSTLSASSNNHAYGQSFINGVLGRHDIMNPLAVRCVSIQ